MISLVTAAALLASLLVGVEFAEPVLSGDRNVAAARPRDFGAVPVAAAPLPEDGGTWEAPKESGWPAPGELSLSLLGRSTADGMAGGLPVTVSTVNGKRAPASVRVRLLAQAYSQLLGLSGPVIAVDGDEGEVKAAFNYTSLRRLYGGGWGSRMTLVKLPSCAASTPRASGCQKTTPVKVDKDASDEELSTDVETSSSGSSVFAITADTSSEEGDYKATDLKASGSWTGGDSSGEFSYSNPLRLPPAEGPVPEISLNYSSQVVDGRMAGANNQASWVGDGWEYAPGFIERTYVTCNDDRTAVNGQDPNNKSMETYDQCWKGSSPSVTVSLNGANTTLIKDDATGAWRAQADANWKVELAGSPASSSAATTERWVITTPDGTQYYYAGEVSTSNSRWTMPVFGNHAGEACRATEFKNSSCQQAWRWLLDKAVDVHGNMARYYYTAETGHYGAAGDKNNRVSFTRGGYLNRIEYGLHTAYPTVAATARVVFKTDDRCLVSECFKDGKPVNANWPDVPWDKECQAAPCTDKLAPVFFSTKRFTKITTQVREGATFSDVESWTLAHEFKAPKVAGSASLWLKEIIHAGHVGGTVTEPAVRFTGVELVNRANALAGAPLFSRWRIQNIRTESGADIHVTYSEPDCDTNDLPSAPENNSRRCYPVYWTPDGYYEPALDWFHKYVVTEVSEIDHTADQPPITTSYEYSNSGGGTGVLWGWDDSEFIKKKHRTYGQWRGYAQVTTKVGEPASANRLTTRKRFYRGLDAQPLPNGGKRTVVVADSEGNTYPDHEVLAGATLEEATLDGGTIVEASTTQYWTKQTASRSHAGGVDRAYLVGPSVEKTRTLLAPGAWARTEQRTTYNDEGLPLTVSDLGDTSKPGDETCTRTTYVVNKTAWIRETVSRVETVAKACDQSVSRPADVISDVKTFYDGSDTHGAAPTKGLVTREDTLDSWNGGPVYLTTSRSSYDALGRVLSVTDARGQVTTTTYTPAGPGPTTQTVTKNPLRHEVTTYQHPAWAEPTAIVDANDKRTDLEHDPLGRLTKVWLPGRATTKSPNMEFSYLIRDDGPLAVTTKRIGPNGGYITEVGLFDSLYRSVQTQEDGPAGSRLVGSTGYNDRGLEAYTSGPNHATDAPGNTLLEITPGADRSRTVYTYDNVGRVVKEALWSKQQELWSTTTAYGGNTQGWQATITPPQGGTAAATITDIHGQTVELRQFHASTPTGSYDATRYTYTPRGDLATVTNALGKTWTYTYDLRGREIRTEDPDKGKTELVYDNADDVISSTNALGETVSTEYDELGRQRKRFFNGQLAAEWLYDTVKKGHLTKSTSIVDGYSFVQQVYEYNDAYQVVDEEVTIPKMPGLQSVAGTYWATYTFAEDGSPHRATLPALGSLESEVIAHTYDDLGNVTRLVGTSYPSGKNTVYVDSTKYSPYGELLERKMGANGGPQAYQTYVYEEATRRLSQFFFDRDATIPNVAALKYTYDPAGNVLSMANRPQDVDGNPRPGASDVQCFRYDHLQRLTRAWSQATECAASPSADVVGGVAPYWMSYALDAGGSRTSVTDHRSDVTSDYGYLQSGTSHAVRTVTTGSQVDHYDWNAIGNLTYRLVGGVTETFTWSPHGKLTGISGPGGDNRMIYDVDGNRIARTDADGSVTAYVFNHELSWDEASSSLTATRYYEHAGDTIASRSATTGVGAADLIWLGSDQHDSAMWSVNSVTRVETIRYADPYGNPRGSTGGTWKAGQRGFVGGIEDPTGLILLGARYYDPRLGSFISVDPDIDEYDPQRMHPFAYANNSPATFADPDGLFFGKIKNAVKSAGNAAVNAAKATTKAIVDNAGTISAVAGTVALVATFLPPPAQVVAAAAGAIAAVAGAIDTAKSCAARDKMGCAVGIASMIPGVRQTRTAVRGAGAVKNAGRKLAKSCNSFLPGTQVLMADGTYKPIEDIRLDDVVWASDPETGNEGARPVTALITGDGEKKLVDISVDADGDGTADSTISATDGHPFWVDNQRQWLRAEHLNPGDQLLTPDGARVTVIAIVAYNAVATVHNLTVDDIHTYYVLAGEADVLVHNTGNPDECPIEAGRELAENAAKKADKRNIRATDAKGGARGALEANEKFDSWRFGGLLAFLEDMHILPAHWGPLVSSSPHVIRATVLIKGFARGLREYGTKPRYKPRPKRVYPPPKPKPASPRSPYGKSGLPDWKVQQLKDI
ncbi:polymorphic toxin-type HINT domain-containing protein [Rhizomonospora bruguierae]|uniref:polymorphic toxin-type HINT domain-containing protein n=1 Tax=Rhizomonospora bruguierae TaxID=1581705 RepID=UPI001BCC993B|nr:polymorphic toxin-type HINT domain-containing protein [Micromonospora sp. NBRC 107566]